MKTLTKLAAAAALALAIPACGSHAHAVPPKGGVVRGKDDGGSFLPAYLAILQSRKFPPDTCAVDSVADLFACDHP
jgi:hypothetical protein